MVIADLSFLWTTIKKGMEAGRNRWRMVLQSGMFYVALETCLGPLHAVSHLRCFWHAFMLSGASETHLGYVSVSQTHSVYALTPSEASEAHCACLHVISRAQDAFWMLWHHLKGLRRVLDAFTPSRKSEMCYGLLHTVSRALHRPESFRRVSDTFTPSREFQTHSEWIHTLSWVPEVFRHFHAVSRISVALRTPSCCLKHFDCVWNAFTPSWAF
jgi:hypothetical protein